MKKILLSAAVLISFTLAAQAQFKAGVIAGGNIYDQRINVTNGSLYGSGNFKSYHAGVIADVQIAGRLYLQPQLLFARKGATHFSAATEQEIKLRMSYVELPLNVVYKAEIPFGKVFAGAGGAFSYAVAGKETQGDITTKLFSATNKNWKREDVSLTFTAGVELDNGLFARANAQKGLLDIHKAAGVTVKNKSWSVSVGYLFDWSKLKGKG